MHNNKKNLKKKKKKRKENYYWKGEVKVYVQIKFLQLIESENIFSISDKNENKNLGILLNFESHTCTGFTMAVITGGSRFLEIISVTFQVGSGLHK